MISLILPPNIKRVLICADNDSPGQRAAEEAAARYYKQGVQVETIQPEQTGFDFNDLLLLNGKGGQ
jgi:DNA primase